MCCTLLSLFLCWMTISFLDGLISTTPVTDPPTVNEHAYCQSEYFRVKCGHSEVIVIKRARYGRMRISRCVREHFGYIGCSSDVRDTLDLHCSGRRTCSVRVLDDNFDNVRPCHDDLKSYLEVDYDCIKVLGSERKSCQFGTQLSAVHPLGVTTVNWTTNAVTSGYLAGVWAADSGCGTTDSPWVVHVGRGQRVNVTLFDYSVPDHHYETTPQSPQLNATTTVELNRVGRCDGGVTLADSMCVSVIRPSRYNNRQQISCKTSYVAIRESSDSNMATICLGATRRTIYQSLSHVVEIRVSGNKATLNSAGLLVRFDAVGCPDVEAPSDGWAKRSGVDAFVVGCQATSDTSELRCHGSTWVADRPINCTQYDGNWEPAEKMLSGASKHQHDSVSASPPTSLLHNISIGSALVIISVLALLVGLLILVAGVLLINRLHRTGKSTSMVKQSETPTLAVMSSPSVSTSTLAVISSSSVSTPHQRWP